MMQNADDSLTRADSDEMDATDKELATWKQLVKSEVVHFMTRTHWIETSTCNTIAHLRHGAAIAVCNAINHDITWKMEIFH